jgi:prefoldin subunit 5
MESRFFSDLTPAEELKMLKTEAENLNKELDAIGKRIVELEKAPSA